MLLFVVIFGGAIAAGVLAWIYAGWWAGLLALALPVGTLVALALERLELTTVGDRRYELGRLTRR